VLGSLPADGVGHFPAGAGLLGKDDATTVTAQPDYGSLNELGVGHRMQIMDFLLLLPFRKAGRE